MITIQKTFSDQTPSMPPSESHSKIQKPPLSGALQKCLPWKFVLQDTYSLPTSCSFAIRWAHVFSDCFYRFRDQLFRRAYPSDHFWNLKMLWKATTQQTFVLVKTSWRRFEDVFRLRLQKTSSRRLRQDKYIRLGHTSSVNIFRMSSRGLANFKTSSGLLQHLSSS